ncbi:MAG TPA: hypothetical protein VII72_20580 [Myxococcota bacterium]|jgi:hypothetical protein
MSRAGRQLAIVIGAIALGLSGSACTQVVVQETAPQQVSRGQGPPPHAPAHGYRAKTPQGAEVVFDKGLGVYVVVGQPGAYFWGEFYYRQEGGGRWERCDRLDGDWVGIVEASLPPGLRGWHGAPRSSLPGKARGQGPASRGGY